MANERTSLIEGRNNGPLNENDIRRVANTFIGLDRDAAFRYAEGELTRFRVVVSDGEIIAEIVYGPDIFPGNNIVNPNSSLSMRAAAAHELSHFHRWNDKTELEGAYLWHIDEALTSLDAIQRYHNHLNETEIRQLAADAMLRLQRFVQRHRDGFARDE